MSPSLDDRLRTIPDADRGTLPRLASLSEFMIAEHPPDPSPFARELTQEGARRHISSDLSCLFFQTGLYDELLTRLETIDSGSIDGDGELRAELTRNRAECVLVASARLLQWQAPTLALQLLSAESSDMGDLPSSLVAYYVALVRTASVVLPTHEAISLLESIGESLLNAAGANLGSIRKLILAITALRESRPKEALSLLRPAQDPSDGSDLAARRVLRAIAYRYLGHPREETAELLSWLQSIVGLSDALLSARTAAPEYFNTILSQARRLALLAQSAGNRGTLDLIVNEVRRSGESADSPAMLGDGWHWIPLSTDTLDNLERSIGESYVSRRERNLVLILEPRFVVSATTAGKYDLLNVELAAPAQTLADSLGRSFSDERISLIPTMDPDGQYWITIESVAFATAVGVRIRVEPTRFSIGVNAVLLPPSEIPDARRLAEIAKSAHDEIDGPRRSATAARIDTVQRACDEAAALLRPAVAQMLVRSIGRQI